MRKQKFSVEYTDVQFFTVLGHECVVPICYFKGKDSYNFDRTVSLLFANPYQDDFRTAKLSR